MNAAAAVAALAVAAAAGAWAGFDWRDARAQRERAAAVDEALQEQAALASRMEESHARALEALARARIDRDHAEAAGRDFRVRLDAAVAAARAASAAGGEAAAGDGDPIGVLAGVLERADKTAGELADFADRSRDHGLACERSYEALKRR